MVLKDASVSMQDPADDAFDRSLPSRVPLGGWDADDRRRKVERDISVANAATWRWRILGAVALTVVWGWAFRWQVTAVENHNEASSVVVMVNRWTGEIRWVQSGQWLKVEEMR